MAVRGIRIPWLNVIPGSTRGAPVASHWRHFDFSLLGAVALLTIFGVTMIRSTVAGNIALTELNLVSRQIIFAVIGFVVIFIAASIDYHVWASISNPLFVITVIFLAALTIAGQALYGSARWFDTGVILIQPSELAKIVMILTLGNFFTRNREKLASFGWVLRSLALAFLIVFWILAQPNLSTSIVLMVIWFTLLWASGLRWRHVVYFALIGAALLVIGALSFKTLVDNNIIQKYQADRVTNFLNPDPEASYGDNYNIEQALIAIGSGGWLGQGYGHGSQVQLRFLKVRWSDFIFAALSQEFGFVGAVSVMLLLLFVVLRCLWAARLARDTYGALICIGVAVLLGFQGMVNIGVNLQLLPATGLTLPFVSYGGSSLLSNLLGIGLVESVIIRHKALEF